MKKKKIIISLFTMVLMLIMVLSTMTPIYAAVVGNSLKDPDAFDQDATPEEVKTLIKKSSNNYVAVMRIIGVSASLTILAVIAARFMLAAPGEKAEIKKQSVAFVIGAVLLLLQQTL
jgi:hypothetical protein